MVKLAKKRKTKVNKINNNVIISSRLLRKSKKKLDIKMTKKKVNKTKTIKKMVEEHEVRPKKHVPNFE